MGMRSPGWGNVWPLPSKSRQVHGVDKCVTQGFVGEAMGWGSQRSLLTRVGIMVIKEIFLKERQPKHKKEQGERTRQRTPRQQKPGEVQWLCCALEHGTRRGQDCQPQGFCTSCALCTFWAPNRTPYPLRLSSEGLLAPQQPIPKGTFPVVFLAPIRSYPMS